MTKIALFDIDGVVVPEGHLVFSRRLERDFNIDHDLILPFFNNDFYYCLIGEQNITESLQSYLRSWGWTGSVTELLDYWFSRERDVDVRILEAVRQLREKGIVCYIASNQFQERAEYLLEEVDLSRHFDGAFFSAYLGATKAESIFFERVMERLDFPDPHEIVFWDDVERYVACASDSGIDARLYSDFDMFQDEVNVILHA